jgi:hypothetical protein
MVGIDSAAAAWGYTAAHVKMLLVMGCVEANPGPPKRVPPDADRCIDTVPPTGRRCKNWICHKKPE